MAALAARHGLFRYAHTEDAGVEALLRLDPAPQVLWAYAGMSTAPAAIGRLLGHYSRVMHLWKAGDLHKMYEYLDRNDLRPHEHFRRLLRSLIELFPHGSEERSLLESLSNHDQAKGTVDDRQLAMPQGG